MKTQLNRRLFIKNSSTASCALLLSTTLSAFSYPEDEIPDPQKLNYCGYTCPENCQFLEASIKNDNELKKKAFETWHIKERYNVDFDPKTSFCFGCKNEDKPVGVVMKNCSVRSCAIAKNHDACIQCKHLKTCDKDLWTRFPDFHKGVLKMQVTYFEAKE